MKHISNFLPEYNFNAGHKTIKQEVYERVEKVASTFVPDKNHSLVLANMQAVDDLVAFIKENF